MIKLANYVLRISAIENSMQDGLVTSGSTQSVECLQEEEGRAETEEGPSQNSWQAWCPH